MSWDWHLEVDTGGPEPLKIDDFWLEEGRDPGIVITNYTYNCGPMFSEAVGRSLSSLDGLPAQDALSVLRKAIKTIKYEARKYEAMNPKNGWGDRQGFLGFLQQMALVLEAHPKATLRIA